MAADIVKGQRLDQLVVTLLPELSRSSAAKLIIDGRVQVNTKIQLKPSALVKVNDAVNIDYDKAKAEAIPEITLEILYEDDDCVVIVKPLGLLTHSKGQFNPEATVATWLQPRVRHLEGERGGIVHRLDRATSGVMICAKHSEAQSWLQKQFANRRVKKSYIAVVSGHMPSPTALIDMPIQRNPKHPQTFRTHINGKSAQTLYIVEHETSELTRLLLKPTTGRTHQLRVHLSSVGHPIVGDTLYGGLSADRLYLHAYSLEVTLPNHQREIFTAPVPPSFTALLTS
jgi:23S rRNA pseudouridine1911/1915/1917 synthase